MTGVERYYNVTGDRYRLHAYVAQGGVIRDAAMASVTFKWVYTNRPEGCRYAVTSQWDTPSHSWRFMSFDLFATAQEIRQATGQVVRLHPPKPRLMHTDLDAIIMGTVLLYNNGGSDA
jgi:hypothetical protein